MDILLHLLMGPALAIPCAQPALLQLGATWPVQSAEVCFVRAPKRVLPQLIIA